MKKYHFPHETIEFRSGPTENNNDGYWYTYSSFHMNVPKNNKHYRIYLSRRANEYKKYHAKVRKSIANNQLSSVSAHKAWLTRELKYLHRSFKRDIFEQCNELLANQ